MATRVSAVMWSISMVSRERSLSTHVLARPDSRRAMQPIAWIAFRATSTLTSVAHSLEERKTDDKLLPPDEADKMQSNSTALQFFIGG